jgi:hypothetical protein
MSDGGAFLGRGNKSSGTRKRVLLSSMHKTFEVDQNEQEISKSVKNNLRKTSTLANGLKMSIA